MSLDSQDSVGILYIVATPIGNLSDISQRAIATLEAVDWIAAEDTRHSRGLLNSLGLAKPLLSLHEHNEIQRAEQLLQKLQAGEQGALISDAGTPLINDPGYILVKQLRQAHIQVVPIPGPSAIITALSAAGLPTDRFCYEGFLPARNSKREQALKQLLNEPRTLVFYESPHRLIESLTSIQNVFGSEREIVVAREMTKKFEQFISGTVSEVYDYFATHAEKRRGEFVFMLAGADLEPETGEKLWAEVDPLIELMLKEALPVKQISTIVAQFSGLKKKSVYQRTLELK